MCAGSCLQEDDTGRGAGKVERGSPKDNQRDGRVNCWYIIGRKPIKESGNGRKISDGVTGNFK